MTPLGGSYFLETLTQQLADGAYDYFRKVEDVGGTVKALESGFLQREIALAAYQYQQELDRNQRTVVGVNDYTAGDALEIPILEMDREGETLQLRRLNEVRRSRDNHAVKQRLADLEAAARGQQNLMPPILDAVREYATLGEVMGVFRQVFGEYRPSWGI